MGKKYEYKVFGRYLDISSAQKDLNEYGAEGWRLSRLIGKSISGIRNISLIMERELDNGVEEV